MTKVERLAFDLCHFDCEPLRAVGMSGRTRDGIDELWGDFLGYLVDGVRDFRN